MRQPIDFMGYLHEKLQDPLEARLFLQVALELYEEDKNTEAFLMALRTLTEAQGGISRLAERTQLNRQNLYRALSARGNPKLATIGTILHGLGFKLSVKPLVSGDSHQESGNRKETS